MPLPAAADKVGVKRFINTLGVFLDPGFGFVKLFRLGVGVVVLQSAGVFPRGRLHVTRQGHQSSVAGGAAIEAILVLIHNL